MNLDELQTVQARERETDSLQSLRTSFYDEAAEFVADLRSERDRVAAETDDPFESPEVKRLSDDVATAERTIEALYDRRVGKVVKLASLSAADMAVERDGLTRQERELFDRLVSAIRENRTRVLDQLPGADGGGTPDTQPSAGTSSGGPAPDSPAAPDGAAPSAGDGGGSDGAREHPPEPGGSTRADSEPPHEQPAPEGDGDPAGPGQDVERRTVRITADVGSILGVDEREYDLSRDDVVTLPAANADPLVDRDAAEPME